MTDVRKSLSKLLACACLASAGGACNPREKVVRIALAAPLTGDIGTEGQGLRRAMELAVEEANASKRFPFRLEVSPYDDRADPAEAVKAARLILLDPRVVAVVGHYNSDCAIAAARVYASGALPMISPAATNPRLTRQQAESGWAGPRVAFRVVPTDDVQGAYAARFVFDRLRRRRLAVLHDGTAYGEGLAHEFQKAFAALGGRVAFEAGAPSGTRDFKPWIEKARQVQADGVYFGGLYTEAGLLVKQVREAGLKLPFISGDGARTPALFDVAGPAADGVYATSLGVPVERLPRAASFIERYRRRWQGPGEELKPFDHFAYEACQILFAALRRSGPNRGRLLSALRLTRYTGLLGVTSFDEKGDRLERSVTMTRARAKDRSFGPA